MTFLFAAMENPHYEDVPMPDIWIASSNSPKITGQPYGYLLDRPLQSNQSVPQKAGQRQQLSKERWEELRAPIIRLYINEGKTREQVAQILCEDYGFQPTKRQLTRRLTEWALKKNVSRKREKSVTPVDDEGNAHALHVNLAGIDAQSPAQYHSPQEDASQEDPVKSSATAGDCWPFKGSIVDVMNSPNLTGLFAALKLEVPDDCPEFALPPATFPPPEPTQKQYVSNFELMHITSRENDAEDETQDEAQVTDHGIAEVPESFNSHELVCWAQRSRQDRIESPWKPWGLDADFSTGNYCYYSSPFNELYPFPRCQQIINHKSMPTKTVASYYQEKCLQYGNSIGKLKGHLPETHPNFLVMIEKQADAHWSLGQVHKASALYQKLLALVQIAYQPDSIEVLRISCEVAFILCQEGRSKQAEQLHRKVHQNNVSLLAHDDPLLLKSLYVKSIIKGEIGLYKEEEALLRELVQISISSFGPKHTSVLVALRQMGTPMLIQGNFAQSERLLYHVLQMYSSFSSILQSDSVEHIKIANRLCQSMRFQRKYEESISLCQTFLRVAESSLGTDHYMTLNLESELAQNLRLLGKLEESEELFRKTIDRQIQLLGEDDEDAMNSMFGLAQLLTSMGRHQEATLLYTRLLRVELDLRGPDNHRTFYVLRKVVRSYEAEKQFGEAERATEEYIEALMALGDEGNSFVTRVREWAATKRSERQFRAELDMQGPDKESTFDAFCHLVCIYDKESRFEESNEVCEHYLDALRDLDGEGDSFIVRVQEFMAITEGSTDSEDQSG